MTSVNHLPDDLLDGLRITFVITCSWPRDHFPDSTIAAARRFPERSFHHPSIACPSTFYCPSIDLADGRYEELAGVTVTAEGGGNAAALERKAEGVVSEPDKKAAAAAEEEEEGGEEQAESMEKLLEQMAFLRDKVITLPSSPSHGLPSSPSLGLHPHPPLASPSASFLGLPSSPSLGFLRLYCASRAARSPTRRAANRPPAQHSRWPG